MVVCYKKLPVINDRGEIETIYHDIYPQQLVLKRDNRSDTEASFLDLEIKIINKKPLP